VTVNVQDVSVAENKSIAATSMITSISKPSGDNITAYAFWDGGTGNGYFTVNGTPQADGQWISVLTGNLNSIQYVGGPAPGSETLYVEAYDATTATWSNYSSLTATTIAPQTQVTVNVRDISVAENNSIAASSMITSLANPGGDNITAYAFWDGGTGNGYFTVNGTPQADGQWISVLTSNLSSIQYVGGPAPGSETLYVEAYDATTATWSNYSSLTATTTMPRIVPIVNVQNVSVAENNSIAASSLIASVSNPSNDNITEYAFWDGGTGNGHFTVSGTPQADGQWITVLATDLSSVRYVGGAAPGSEALFVDVYDATIGTWSNYGSLTASTTVPHVVPIVNLRNVSVAENVSIAASSMITSVSNPSGDSITYYAFWDSGIGNGHFSVNGVSQPDQQWIEVNTSNLSSIKYVGGTAPGTESLYVDVYDDTIGTWSNDGSSLTAATTTTTTSGPSISAVTDNNTTYINAGHFVTITLTTSSAETVTGKPTLQLNDGEVAGYTGGSGTNTLTFSYAVQPGTPGDNTADLQVTGLNLPTGSSIVDSTGKSLPTTITADLGIQIDTLTVPATSVQQEILGLYGALYGRATDFGGISYWTGIVGQQPDGAGITTANAGTTAVTLNDAAVLGQAFVNTQNTYFNSLYGRLTDSAFINAMYVNIGGNAGDPGGVAYWAGILQQAETAGQSVQAARAGLVGQFVHDLVDYNLAAGAAGLTSAQLLAATQRQAAVDNKIAVSLALSDASQQAGGGILVVHAVGDAAFNAAATVIQGVTYDPATVTAAILGINTAVAHQDLSLI
jgi:hypothetical protein